MDDESALARIEATIQQQMHGVATYTLRKCADDLSAALADPTDQRIGELINKWRVQACLIEAECES